MAKSLHLALIITVSPDVFSKEIEDFIRLSFLQPLQYFTLCFFLLLCTPDGHGLVRLWLAQLNRAFWL